MTESRGGDMPLGALRAGATMITANRRLARYWVDCYDRTREEGGEKTWPSPRVLPLEAWLRSAWQGLWSSRSVLPEWVAAGLWEDLVAADADRQGTELLDVAATADLAREAYRLQQLYQIEVTAAECGTDEQRAFLRWSEEYGQVLSAHDWIDGDALAAHLAAHVGALGTADAAPLLLAGFDELPPAYAALLHAWQAQGGEVAAVPFPRRAGCTQVARYTGEQEELAAVAGWLRTCLEAQGRPPRVAVVGVGLESYAVGLERVLARELVPGRVLQPSSPESLPFDLSCGVPLVGEPGVHTAVTLLATTPAKVSWEHWSALLRSPYWGTTAERLGRAALAAELAAGREPALSAGALAGLARSRGLAETARDWTVLAEYAATTAAAVAPGEWANRWRTLLRELNWCTAADLDGREFQAREVFLEVMERLRAFQPLHPVLGHASAMQRLRRLAQQPFRVQGAEDAVPVFGLLEATGQEFDAIWVMGLRAGVFPSPVRVNPFLPYGAQVRAGVRQVQPGAQLQRAQRILQRLAQCADRVTFSCADNVRGVAELPSPLLTAFSPAGTPPRPESFDFAATLHDNPVVLTAVAERAPPVEAPFQVRGGANLLADQAACPFRAFARHRLRLTPVGTPESNLSALERGEGVHRALEYLWLQLGARAALAALDPEGRQRLIADCCRRANRDLAAARSDLSPALLALEQTRIEALLEEWCAVELEREDFDVLGVEQRQELQLGPLHFYLRLDRVDREASTGEVLVDYKTGVPNPARWFEERIREPQLPLYALARSGAQGVGYAVVRAGECKWRVLRATEEGLAGVRGVPEDLCGWSELLAYWRQQLGAMATEFGCGRAEVAPVDEQICRYCELTPLCRVVARGETDLEEGEA